MSSDTNSAQTAEGIQRSDSESSVEPHGEDVTADENTGSEVSEDAVEYTYGMLEDTFRDDSLEDASEAGAQYIDTEEVTETEGRHDSEDTNPDATVDAIEDAGSSVDEIAAKARDDAGEDVLPTSPRGAHAIRLKHTYRKGRRHYQLSNDDCSN